MNIGDVDMAAVGGVISTIGGLGLWRWIKGVLERDRERLGVVEAQLATLQDAYLERSERLSDALARLDEAARDLRAAEVEIGLLREQNKLLSALLRKREIQLVGLGVEISDGAID